MQESIAQLYKDAKVYTEANDRLNRKINKHHEPGYVDYCPVCKETP